MIDYEARLERCKREDTKELIIACLDKASAQNKIDVHNEYIEALEAIGILVSVILISVWILHRMFR